MKDKTPSVKQIKAELRPVPTPPARKFFVLREIEVQAEELQSGDLFRIEPASPADSQHVNPRELFLVDGKPTVFPNLQGTGAENVHIKAVPVVITKHETFVATKNFSKLPENAVATILAKAGMKLEQLPPAQASKIKKSSAKQASKKPTKKKR